ncbi:putative receptor binding protein 1 [Lactococcus phage 51701]|uniref:Putative receptor binding protein 1 n=1 Tax=Lactococcus phage 51701 TaxID=2029664 RepID=A0A343JN85_9CAUD|nr:receptor binding tail protein [Lactococcus phage 51701]ASZ70958.1 putative receptor binding protein 1 [Lactococcus phage 51701]
MTIKNFTFFSPNGTEFPVGSNNDGKLYMMLTGMDYGTIRRKDWSSPSNTALNVQYTNTSIIAGGRYFELLNETVALKTNSVNYIHANIDLTQTANPVSLSAETSNNSNGVDINNNSGVLKVLIDIITTSATGVIKAENPKQVTSLDEVTLNTLIVKGVKGQRSAQVQTPTVYASITGTALKGFLLYRNVNVIIGNFSDITVSGDIPTDGAIIGWITDNDFKPQHTQKFSMYTRFGKRLMLSVDPGGAFRNWGDPISKGDEIYGGVFWICKGTEGGLGS